MSPVKASQTDTFTHLSPFKFAPALVYLFDLKPLLRKLQQERLGSSGPELASIFADRRHLPEDSVVWDLPATVPGATADYPIDLS